MDIKYDNSIALWINNERKSEKSPHYTGEGLINGVEYYANAWKADGTNPKAPEIKIKWISKDEVHKKGMQGVRKTLETKSQPTAKPSEKAPSVIDFEDDIPF